MERVRFNGFPDLPEGHTYCANLQGLDFGRNDIREFDGFLAALCNRTCAAPEDDEARERCLQEHDGACFARAFCAEQNAVLPPSDPPPFETLPAETLPDVVPLFDVAPPALRPLRSFFRPFPTQGDRS